MAGERATDKLRRGFKTDADALSRELRAELGLTSVAPLSPQVLADHLDIPLVPLSSYGDAALTRFFRGKGRSRFSATTVFVTSTKRVIVYNDFHAQTRQASDIMHECAHGLLLHEPRIAFGPGGCRDVDDACEQEAAWLGGYLLVPNDAALYVVRRGLSLEDAAAEYGVSQDLIRWRIQMSGARKILERVRAKWNVRRGRGN